MPELEPASEGRVRDIGLALAKRWIDKKVWAVVRDSTGNSKAFYVSLFYGILTAITPSHNNIIPKVWTGVSTRENIIGIFAVLWPSMILISKVE